MGGNGHTRGVNSEVNHMHLGGSIHAIETTMWPRLTIIPKVGIVFGQVTFLVLDFMWTLSIYGPPNRCGGILVT